MEEDGEVDGYHQALLPVSCNWSELEANGAVWRETINGSVDVQAMCHTRPLTDGHCRNTIPCFPVPFRRTPNPISTPSPRTREPTGPIE